MSSASFLTGRGPPLPAAELPLSHADYSVGWISALSREFTAAMAMLDERHPPLPPLLHDDNVYVLGRIRSHNTAMVCLPAGHLGNNAAATAASQMRRTFPAVRFWLMVGIGGGAPSPEHDIRLGDVVVSSPGKNDAGVIQYDFGRTVEAGQFIRSGMLNAPPILLLNAVNALQAVHGIHGHQLREHMKVFEESDALRPKYTYQGWEKDVIFEASYDHPRNASDCLQCDKSRLVARDARWEPSYPMIHYGSIASGNQIMRHGESRERWRKETGVLCFEMEAAGLMNNFPCLVIRGICDYADSHKNKTWQEYSAATAAAYAKELLSIVPAYAMPTNAAPTGTTTAGQARTETGTERELRMLRPVPLSHIPLQRNPLFSGRKYVLASIDAHFARCKTQQAYILRGMGGIGKTQIALEYAYQSIDAGFDVFWVNCTTPQALFSDFNQIQKSVKAIKKGDYEADRTSVLRWLEEHTHWLLIFDNADDAGFGYANWIPRNTGNPSIQRIVFTTRDERLSGAVCGVKGEVPLMEEDEAIDLFMANGAATDLHKDVASIKALMQRLANLPLAIALASAYLREYSWITVDQYLEAMNNFSHRSRIFRYQQAFSNYNHSIMSTWEISFTRVQCDNPKAADLLTLLGFLVNGGVVLGWLKRASVHAANSDLGFLDDADSLDQLLGLLRSLALIYFDGATISLHPLVHEWIQARLQGEKLAVWGITALTAIYCAHVQYAYPHSGVLDIGEGDQCLDHTKFALKAVSQHGLPPSTLPQECYLLLLTILVYDGDISSGLCEIKLRANHEENHDTGSISEDLPPRRRNWRSLSRVFTSPRVLGRNFAVKSRSWYGSAVDLANSSAGQGRVSYGAFKDALYQTTGSAERSASSSISNMPTRLSDVWHNSSSITSMATKMHHKIDSDSTDLCTRLAIALVKLDCWWRSHSANDSLNDPVQTDVTESCEKLQSIIDICRTIPGRRKSIDRYPPKILALLVIYVSSAAMSMGLPIDMKLEKPTEHLRMWLFQKALDICHQLEGEARNSLLLDANISYARFVDVRSMRGPSHWLPVEECFSGSFEYAFHKSEWRADVSMFFDYFCQSMWESEHEYALLRLCCLIQQKEPRISLKWKTRLEARWHQLNLSDDTFTNLSAAEAAIISRFTNLETLEPSLTN